LSSCSLISSFTVSPIILSNLKKTPRKVKRRGKTYRDALANGIGLASQTVFQYHMADLLHFFLDTLIDSW
jgi:hypothetical protein